MQKFKKRDGFDVGSIFFYCLIDPLGDSSLDDIGHGMPLRETFF